MYTTKYQKELNRRLRDVAEFVRKGKIAVGMTKRITLEEVYEDIVDDPEIRAEIEDAMEHEIAR